MSIWIQTRCTNNTMGGNWTQARKNGMIDLTNEMHLLFLQLSLFFFIFFLSFCIHLCVILSHLCTLFVKQNRMQIKVVEVWGRHNNDVKRSTNQKKRHDRHQKKWCKATYGNDANKMKKLIPPTTSFCIFKNHKTK